MKVVFRADASSQIGTGHVMRCLTLADFLRKQGMRTVFVCRELPGFFPEMVTEKGHELVLLSRPEQFVSKRCSGGPAHSFWLGVSWEDDAAEILKKINQIDWLVVDHYALERCWEVALRGVAKRIFVIDDLADREHDCDLLLDQNFFENSELRYRGLVPEFCKCLLGPRFALLRDEFLKMRQSLPQKNGKIHNVFVCFGGGDAHNETRKALRALRIFEGKDVFVDVVAGKANPHAEVIEDMCRTMTFASFYHGVANMAELMSKADLAIGAGGVVSWERCSLSLPSIVIAIAENQIGISKGLDSVGVVRYLGEYQDVSPDDIGSALQDFIFDEDLVVKMGQRAGSLVDARGTERIFYELEKWS